MLKPIPKLSDTLEEWLILADYYEEIKYDTVVRFIKTSMKDWVDWLMEHAYQPYWFTDDSTRNRYAWIVEYFDHIDNYKYACLPRELYYRIKPLNSFDYTPESVYATKEEAYFDLFLAWLE